MKINLNFLPNNKRKRRKNMDRRCLPLQEHQNSLRGRRIQKKVRHLERCSKVKLDLTIISKNTHNTTSTSLSDKMAYRIVDSLNTSMRPSTKSAQPLKSPSRVNMSREMIILIEISNGSSLIRLSHFVPIESRKYRVVLKFQTIGSLCLGINSSKYYTKFMTIVLSMPMR